MRDLQLPTLTGHAGGRCAHESGSANSHDPTARQAGGRCAANAADAAGGGGRRAADRVREHCQFAAGANGKPAEGTGSTRGDRSKPPAPDAAIADRRSADRIFRRAAGMGDRGSGSSAAAGVCAAKFSAGAEHLDG